MESLECQSKEQKMFDMTVEPAHWENDCWDKIVEAKAKLESMDKTDEGYHAAWIDLMCLEGEVYKLGYVIGGLLPKNSEPDTFSEARDLLTS